jgi:hypothetical protein
MRSDSHKEKCKHLVLVQIKQLVQRTYEDTTDLVQFVDSSAVQSPSSMTASFNQLEVASRTFVLTRRSKSKLHRIASFLSRLLDDVEFVTSSNSILAEREVRRARDDLAHIRPVFENMQNERESKTPSRPSRVVDPLKLPSLHVNPFWPLSRTLDKVNSASIKLFRCQPLRVYSTPGNMLATDGGLSWRLWMQLWGQLRTKRVRRQSLELNRSPISPRHTYQRVSKSVGLHARSDDIIDQRQRVASETSPVQ